MATDEFVLAPKAGEASQSADQQFFRFPNGQISNALLHFNTKRARIDKINDTAVVKGEKFLLTAVNHSKIKRYLNLQSAKLLLYGEMQFVQNNSENPNGRINYRVSITIPGFADMAHWSLTSEEAARNIGKKLKLHLDALRSIDINGKEYTGRKKHSFEKVNLIGSRGIEGNEVYFYFDPKYGEYLLSSKGYVQYSPLLFRCSSVNSLWIGEKICEHYTQARNHVTGTPNRLKVSTLLECTELQTFENSEKHDQGHWRENLKDRLEDYVEELVSIGLLKSWEYVYPGGEKIPDGIDVASSYNAWSNLCVEYAFASPPDLSKQIAEAKKIHDEVSKRADDRRLQRKIDAIDKANIEAENRADSTAAATAEFSKSDDEQSVPKLPPKKKKRPAESGS